jgi:hypothetical protein
MFFNLQGYLCGKLVHCLLTPNATLIESQEPYMGNDVSLTMDKEFDEEEAQLGLELARARHIVCRLERELAEARCAESIALVGLYKHRAEGARTRHDHAEYDLGLARDLVTRKGSSSWNISVIGKPSAKRPRLASPGDHK